MIEVIANDTTAKLPEANDKRPRGRAKKAREVMRKGMISVNRNKCDLPELFW